ncbi:hemerythrin domain-containing protein [Acidovorax lacteus]|uniref:Hemerythrin-like domain-containing protein n=1 Tax=Acidovorax lacteus TaxID=1924988 RepID=A0ABP8LJZ0_9BURK
MSLPLSVRILREEHASLTAVLHSLRTLMEEGPDHAGAAFFDAMRAMLFYIDEFPERQHHPRETQFLFEPLAQRAPEVAATLERLEAEHRHGEQQVRALQQQLLAWELLGESRRPAFAQGLQRYVGHYLDHMRREETELLPAALAHLTPEDWAAADAAFAAHVHPLSGHPGRDPAYDRLFTRIVLRAPGPFGLRDAAGQASRTQAALRPQAQAAAFKAG